MTDATPPAPKPLATMRAEILAAVSGQDHEAALIATIDALTMQIVDAAGGDQKRAIGMTAVIALEIRKTLTNNWKAMTTPVPAVVRTGPMQ